MIRDASGKGQIGSAHTRVMMALISSLLILSACVDSNENSGLSDADLTAIRSLNETYVQAWLQDDTLSVLNTLADDAIIMPAGLRPISGKKNIRKFWWPGDGSRTVITDYTMEVKEIEGSGDIAYSRGAGRITFTYEKNGENSEHNNATMSLTVYRRQPDGGWQIWRRMWGQLQR